jgi:branched-subunit amino acid transport protein
VIPADVWRTVAGCASVAILARGIGPAAAGSRQLPAPLTRVVVLLAPALLAGLLVVSVATDHGRLAVGANTAGVAAAAVLVWRRANFLVVVFAAALVTAVLRQFGVD